MGITVFTYQFRIVIIRYKHTGYNLNVMRQSVCLVINPPTIDSFVSLYNYTPVDRASDTSIVPT